MIQGTASSVGKSLMVAALCRIFRDQGLRVAPFKSQNMALNSAVTADGLEIGRAQAVQARAAGIEPAVEMNPILLKPEASMCAQVVLRGRPIGTMRSGAYQQRRPELVAAIADSLDTLRSNYDVVVIEGAGSPAEINLKDRDLVNGFVAEMANAPVLLVGDIDRGGVFASFFGTLALLDDAERARIKGLIVNKFRGEYDILAPALPMIEERVGRPVLGVVPFIHDLLLPEEDSMALADRQAGRASTTELEIAVLALPHLSNFDDFLPLQRHPAMTVRWVDTPRDVLRADLVIVPGTKSTVHDLEWIRKKDLDRALGARAELGFPILGICGGCQMLGTQIEDPSHIESDADCTPGMKLLPVRTTFHAEKVTKRVAARATRDSFLCPKDSEVEGYFIHMGRATTSDARAVFEARDATNHYTEGVVSPDGAVVGTMIHGLFESSEVVDGLARSLSQRAGFAIDEADPFHPNPEDEYDRLASHVRNALDMDQIMQIIEVKP